MSRPFLQLGKVMCRDGITCPGPPQARKVRIRTETQCLFRAQSAAYPPCQSYVCLRGKTKDCYCQRRPGSLSTAPEPLCVSTTGLSSSSLGSGLWVFPAPHRDVSCSQPVFPASLCLWPPEEGNGRMVLARTQRQTPIHSFLTWRGGRNWN